MNKGDPLNIKIKALEGPLINHNLEFLPNAKVVAKKKPKSKAKIAKYIFQIMPEPIKTNCSHNVISDFGKRRSPYPIDLNP